MAYKTNKEKDESPSPVLFTQKRQARAFVFYCEIPKRLTALAQHTSNYPYTLLNP